MHGYCTRAEQNSKLAKTVLTLTAEIIFIIIQGNFTSRSQVSSILQLPASELGGTITGPKRELSVYLIALQVMVVSLATVHVNTALSVSLLS
jgi:hypothetical protein